MLAPVGSRITPPKRAPEVWADAKAPKTTDANPTSMGLNRCYCSATQCRGLQHPLPHHQHRHLVRLQPHFHHSLIPPVVPPRPQVVLGKNPGERRSARMKVQKRFSALISLA